MIFPTPDNESERWAEESEDWIWGAWECLLFPSVAWAASLADGGGIRQKICEHVGCKQDTTRLCGASTWQRDALGFLQSPGGHLFSHHSRGCLARWRLSEIHQGLRLWTSSAASDLENWGPECYQICTSNWRQGEAFSFSPTNQCLGLLFILVFL